MFHKVEEVKTACSSDVDRESAEFNLYDVECLKKLAVQFSRLGRLISDLQSTGTLAIHSCSSSEVVSIDKFVLTRCIECEEPVGGSWM